MYRYVITAYNRPRDWGWSLEAAMQHPVCPRGLDWQEVEPGTRWKAGVWEIVRVAYRAQPKRAFELETVA